MNRCILTCWMVLAGWLPAFSSPGDESPGPDASGSELSFQSIDPSGLFDGLPLLPDFRTVHQYSSHNREGKNGDAGWRLYNDENGDAVIFDVEGPGCIRSMWSTDVQEGAVFQFTFDGEEEPRYRIPMRHFFEGKHALFPAPLVSYELRGRWGDHPYAGNSFVPIPFAKGLKISVSGKIEFYHIIYERYPFGSRIETFTGKEDRSGLLWAFEHLGEAPSAFEEAQRYGTEFDKIDPGKSVMLLNLKEGGCIREMVIEGEGSDAFIREAQIRMRWDGHALWDVLAPLGFFFGTAARAANLRTLPMRAETLDQGRVRLTSWFPMPFWREAEIHLVNRSSKALGTIRAEVTVCGNGYPEDRSGHFTALFRKGRTTHGQDWLFCEYPGAGRFVGAVQSMKGEHYCEGDEHITIDDAVSPQINGTGSEDYYLGCFWPNREFNSPFANCVGDIQELGGGTFESAYGVPSCYSRFHLEAPVPFYARLDARIQHGGLSHIQSDYASLAFCYLRRRPALVQTDYIDVGQSFSEEAHQYQAKESGIATDVEGRPEGNEQWTAYRETGRRHNGGVISFRVAVDPANSGVRLRRRLDQASPRQTAEVYIDGERAGTWYHADCNEYLRWFDSDFDLHPMFTQGKASLEVRLIVQSREGRGAFTHFSYRVFSFVP